MLLVSWESMAGQGSQTEWPQETQRRSAKKKIGWPKKEKEVKKRSLIFLLLSPLSAAPSGVLGIPEKQWYFNFTKRLASFLKGIIFLNGTHRVTAVHASA
jgi:hypothetical protein